MLDRRGHKSTTPPSSCWAFRPGRCHIHRNPLHYNAENRPSWRSSPCASTCPRRLSPQRQPTRAHSRPSALRSDDLPTPERREIGPRARYAHDSRCCHPRWWSSWQSLRSDSHSPYAKMKERERRHGSHQAITLASSGVCRLSLKWSLNDSK